MRILGQSDSEYSADLTASRQQSGRRVRALGYSILEGPNGVDGNAVHSKDADAGATRIAGRPLRVGWVTDAVFGPVDPEITVVVVSAVGRLADLGHEVEQVELPFLDNPIGALMTLVYGEIVPSIKALAAGREEQLHAIGAGIVGVPDPPFADYLAAEAQGEERRYAISGFFERCDVLLTPANPMTATPRSVQDLVVNGQPVAWMHVMAATSPFNLAGLPLLSVPYALSSEQLPIGIQLLGKWLDEATLLRLGSMLERRGGLGDRRPNL